jgi:hypothetical protein
MDWVDEDHSDAGEMKFKSFKSATIGGDVSYMIWLPPDYETNRDGVILFSELPASGGTPRRDTPRVVKQVEKGIREGRTRR